MHHVWIPYCGAAPVPSELLSRWNFDPALLLVLAALPLLYFRALRAAERAPAAFWGAWGLAVLLFVSPFCALTSALFSARTVHHLLIVIVLAPLVVLALPRLRIAGAGALWVTLQAAVFWAWHAPAAYSAALSNDAVYWSMQLSMIGTAVLFWAWIRNASMISAVAGLLATMVAMGLLGALLTFAGSALYVPHFETTLPWGLGALEDQQLAGLVMWAPGGGFYLAAAVLLASRWLRREELAGAAP